VAQPHPPRAGGQSPPRSRAPLRPTEQTPPRSRVADLPSGGSLISASLEGSPRDPRPRNRISASLEGSGPALERVANLRLARGQRTCPRAGGQSPPRSRTADLPSSGWPISASLEAISRHKRQMAPPPNRPPYEGIKSQPLHHGSKGRRRQTATPAVDVTGVPSTDPGHRSATPVAVAVLWAFNAARGKLAPPPLLFCRHPSPDPSPAGEGVRRCHVSCQEGHSARTGATPDLPLVGSGTSTRSRTF
jgi:hypothetical protein